MIELKSEELSLVTGGQNGQNGQFIQPDFKSYAGNALVAGALGARGGPVGALGAAGTSLATSVIVDAARSLPVKVAIPSPLPMTPVFRTPPQLVRR